MSVGGSRRSVPSLGRLWVGSFLGLVAGWGRRRAGPSSWARRQECKEILSFAAIAHYEVVRYVKAGALPYPSVL